MHIMHVCRMQIRVIHLCIMRVTNWDEWMNRNLNSSSRISICDNVNIFLHFWHVVMRWAGATTWSRSDQCLVTAPTLSGACTDFISAFPLRQNISIQMHCCKFTEVPSMCKWGPVDRGTFRIALLLCETSFLDALASLKVHIVTDWLTDWVAD